MQESLKCIRRRPSLGSRRPSQGVRSELAGELDDKVGLAADHQWFNSVT